MAKTLVISRVFPPEVGGNGRWMWELYSRLPPGEFLVVAAQFHGAELFERPNELPVIRLPMQLSSWGILGWRRSAAYYAIYVRLRRIACEQAIQAIHASNCLPEGVLAWMLSRRLGLPYLVYVHGEELNIAAQSRELTWMVGRVYRDAAQLIANSRNTAQLLCETWPESAKRVYVMHPGVDTEKFKPAPYNPEDRRKLRWDNRSVVLTVGRLMKRKGHERIIRALPQISRSVPNVLYAIVGDGDERQRLMQVVADLALNDRVVFHGELDSHDLVTAYQQCDVFAMPDHEVQGDFEGFGMVFLEAQASGKPVIAGDSGGAGEAINSPHSGLIVRSDRSDELSQTLIHLFLDRERRERMGRAGRDWVVRNFDWRLLVKEACRIFANASRGDESSDVSEPVVAELR
jgi:phosphatidylinositol alpha-1,6-mannosyltransferase